jgi:putative MATE family efflux protein
MNESKNDLRLWQLAWPAVLANLLQSTVGLVDVKVVGTLGASAVAAATTSQRLFFVTQATLTAVSAGTTALVARAWGAGNREQAGRVVGSSLMIACVLGLGLGAAGLLMAEPIAAAFGLEGAARPLTVIYIHWQSCFTIPFAVGFVIAAGLRAAGDTRTPFAFGIVSNVVNILLLYLLVFGAWGFPKLAVKGAAMAGGIAFTVSGALALWLWQRDKLLIKRTRGPAPHDSHMQALLAIGYPAAIEQLVVQSGFVAFTILIARCFGSKALAAYGIGVQILSLSYVVGFGFAVAASTMVGQHLGASEPESAARSAWRATRLAVGAMSLLALLVTACARQLATLMISDPQVVRLTVSFIYLLGAAQPLMAIEFALGGALRGAGDTRFPLLASFVGLILGRVLIAGLLTWLGFSVEWIYGALLCDYTLKAILLVHRFRSGKWKQALTTPQAARIAPAVVATRT